MELTNMMKLSKCSVRKTVCLHTAPLHRVLSSCSIGSFFLFIQSRPDTLTCKLSKLSKFCQHLSPVVSLQSSNQKPSWDVPPSCSIPHPHHQCPKSIPLVHNKFNVKTNLLGFEDLFRYYENFETFFLNHLIYLCIRGGGQLDFSIACIFLTSFFNLISPLLLPLNPLTTSVYVPRLSSALRDRQINLVWSSAPPMSRWVLS